MDITLTNSKRGGAPIAQRQRAEATRNALVAAARVLFTENGYGGTGTNDVVARAAVTRGALYHHFAGKEELFEAVFAEVLEELDREARAEALLAGDTWRQVAAAFTAYLQLIASREAFQRILLIDGPAVLGWRRWRELHAQVAAGIGDALEMLMQQGLIAARRPEPLANLIQAALNDAALTIAYAGDPQAASREAREAFIFLLEGLKTK